MEPRRQFSGEREQRQVGDYLEEGGQLIINSVVDLNSLIHKSAIDSGSSVQDWAAHLILRDHPYSVGCLAWSLNDSILLTSAEHVIKMWDAKVNLTNHLTGMHSHQIL